MNCPEENCATASEAVGSLQEGVPSLRPLCIMRLTLMQTMLHKYEEMQMRLKSQDEEDCGTGTVTTFFFSTKTSTTHYQKLIINRNTTKNKIIKITNKT